LKTKDSKHSHSAKERAVYLLARREHSRKELKNKLIQKGFDISDIERDLQELEDKGWLSDIRFTESWIRHRVESGFGPYRIKSELAERGISRSLIEQAFEEIDVDWVKIAHKVWQKKYNALPQDWAEKVKQMRFLQYRGFFTQDIETMYQMINSEQGDS
jgi:regulatory protein